MYMTYFAVRMPNIYHLRKPTPCTYLKRCLFGLNCISFWSDLKEYLAEDSEEEPADPCDEDSNGNYPELKDYEVLIFTSSGGLL